MAGGAARRRCYVAGVEKRCRSGGNLDACGTSRRLRFGVIALSLALALGVMLVKADVAWFYRALLLVPFYAAASGFYQGLYRT